MYDLGGVSFELNAQNWCKHLKLGILSEGSINNFNLLLPSINMREDEFGSAKIAGNPVGTVGWSATTRHVSYISSSQACQLLFYTQHSLS